jgi:hypothetical protein
VGQRQKDALAKDKKVVARQIQKSFPITIG